MFMLSGVFSGLPAPYPTPSLHWPLYLQAQEEDVTAEEQADEEPAKDEL